MTAAGLAKIEVAKADGSWHALDDSDKLNFPDDFVKELKANETAEKNFYNFSDSIKRAILAWILSAKREETRRARIEKTVNMAANNQRANFDSEE